MPALFTERRYARYSAGRLPPRRWIMGPRAAALAACATLLALAPARNDKKPCTMKNEAMAAHEDNNVAAYTPRGPCRSARRPAGIPAASVTTPAQLSPIPTWLDVRCT